MSQVARRRLVNSPGFRLARWTVPWVILAFVAYTAWGLTADFRNASSRARAQANVAPPKAIQPASTAEKGQTVFTVADGVRMYDVPNSGATVLRVLKRSAALTVIEKQERWYRVRDSVGNVGWVTDDAEFVSTVRAAARKTTSPRLKTRAEKKITLDR